MNPLLAPELRAIKNMGIKPNYSELSRKFKMDRHTIKAAEAATFRPRRAQGRDRGALMPHGRGGRVSRDVTMDFWFRDGSSVRIAARK